MFVLDGLLSFRQINCYPPEISFPQNRGISLYLTSLLSSFPEESSLSFEWLMYLHFLILGVLGIGAKKAPSSA